MSGTRCKRRGDVPTISSACRREGDLLIFCGAAYGLAIPVASENAPRMQSGTEIFYWRSSQCCFFLLRRYNRVGTVAFGPITPKQFLRPDNASGSLLSP